MAQGRELERLVELIAAVAEAFTAALFLPEEKGSHLRLAAFHSLSRNILRDCRIETGSGLVGWVAAHGQPLSVSDFKPETQTLGFYSSDEEIKSFLAVPVALGQRVGVLAVDSKRSYVFPPRMQKVLSLFAGHVGRWLEAEEQRGKLLQATQAVEELEAVARRLAEARTPRAVVDAALSAPLELFGAEGLAVALLEQGGSACRVAQSSGPGMPSCRGLGVNLRQSLTGWVLRHARSLALAECREYYSKSFVFCPEEPYLAVRSFLGVPLRAGGELLGALVALAREPGAFREARVSAFQLLASQTATALRAAASSRRQWVLAYREPTTGLPNARYLRDYGRALLDRALAEGQKVVCLVVVVRDLDLLRLEVGPQAVEEALRQVASVCRSLASQDDLVARTEEGHFVLLCERLSLAAGRSLAERLLAGLKEVCLPEAQGPLGLKAAVGLSLFPDEARELDELLARAVGQPVALRPEVVSGLADPSGEGSDGTS
jgi:signal transduction protein with GAF and PtsI domain